MPKWAQWEGSSHVLLSPRLMRPQLWPSHSAPLALHPGLAAGPSLPIPPTPRAVHQPRSAASTPRSTAHGRSAPPPEAGNFGLGGLGHEYHRRDSAGSPPLPSQVTLAGRPQMEISLDSCPLRDISPFHHLRERPKPGTSKKCRILEGQPSACSPLPSLG